MDPQARLEVVVRNREAVVYHGEVQSLTTINPQGQLDILPAHANFISLISQRIILRLADGGQQEIEVNDGVVRVIRNKVTVLLGIKHASKSKSDSANTNQTQA